jgi:hypothetical protein
VTTLAMPPTPLRSQARAMRTTTVVAELRDTLSAGERQRLVDELI